MLAGTILAGCTSDDDAQVTEGDRLACKLFRQTDREGASGMLSNPAVRERWSEVHLYADELEPEAASLARAWGEPLIDLERRGAAVAAMKDACSSIGQ